MRKLSIKDCDEIGIFIYETILFVISFILLCLYLSVRNQENGQYLFVVFFWAIELILGPFYIFGIILFIILLIGKNKKTFLSIINIIIMLLIIGIIIYMNYAIYFIFFIKL